MHAGGHKYKRVKTALTEIGPSICHGGITTLIGVSLSMAAESKAIFMFGTMTIKGVLIGFVNGLIVLPTVLSVIGHWINQKSRMMNVTWSLLAAVLIFMFVDCEICLGIS